MDWHKIKADSLQLDALLKKEIGISEVNDTVNHMMAVLCYTEAAWVASLPVGSRKQALERVYETLRPDAAAMAKMIIKGEIP